MLKRKISGCVIAFDELHRTFYQVVIGNDGVTVFTDADGRIPPNITGSIVQDGECVLRAFKPVNKQTDRNRHRGIHGPEFIRSRRDLIDQQTFGLHFFRGYGMLRSANHL
jgi:hypothetical protein